MISDIITGRRKTTPGTVMPVSLEYLYFLLDQGEHEWAAWSDHLVTLCCRWNSRSEHLHRKKYHSAGRSGSLDELEEFVQSYKQRRGRVAEEEDGEQGIYEMEFQELSRYPSHRVRPPQRCHEEELESCGRPTDHPRQDKKSRHTISPLHSPKRRAAKDDERTVPPRSTASPPSSLFKEDCDSPFHSSLLEHKAKLRGVVHGKTGGGSDAPSKSSGESSRHGSRVPSSRPEAESLPPYSDSERSRMDRPSPRLPPTNVCSSQTLTPSLTGHREEPRDKTRKAVSYFSSRVLTMASCVENWTFVTCWLTLSVILSLSWKICRLAEEHCCEVIN